MFRELISNARYHSRPHGEYAIGIDSIYAMTIHEGLKLLRYDVPMHVTNAFDEKVKVAVAEFRFGIGQQNEALLDDLWWDHFAAELERESHNYPPEPEHPAQPAHPAHQEQPHPHRYDPDLEEHLKAAEGWLKAYQRYDVGAVTPSTDQERAFFAWARQSPEFQHAYADWQRANDDNQLVMWGDGSQSTRREHREGERRRAIQRALDVLTGNSFGAIGFGIAKAAGASDETATNVGEMAGTAGKMAGGHTQAQQQGASPPTPTPSGPNYGEHPR